MRSLTKYCPFGYPRNSSREIENLSTSKTQIKKSKKTFWIIRNSDRLNHPVLIPVHLRLRPDILSPKRITEGKLTVLVPCGIFLYISELFFHSCIYQHIDTQIQSSTDIRFYRSIISGRNNVCSTTFQCIVVI